MTTAASTATIASLSTSVRPVLWLNFIMAGRRMENRKPLSFPPNLGEVLSRFEKILVPELNLGQLSRLLRAEFLVPAESLSKVFGQPFKVEEIRSRIEEMAGGSS